MMDGGMEELDPSEDVTQEWLDKQLKATKGELQKRVKKLEAVDIPRRNNDEDDDDSKTKNSNPVDRLNEIKDKVEALELTKEVTQWSESCDYHGVDIFREAKDCLALAEILIRHESQTSLHKGLFEREYQPLHGYVRANLILELRKILLQSGYPSAEGCGRLLEQVKSSGGSSSPLAQTCDWLTRLQLTNHHLINHTQLNRGSSFASPWSSGETCDVLVEFFRPIVERVRFHFVEHNAARITSTKIDRLPEWLFKYLQEHVIEGKSSSSSKSSNTSATSTSSPWELITLGLSGYVTEEMPILFLNELVGLVQYVLGGSERNFFRHPNVAGPESNPMLLCNAIEQLLEFDDTLRNLLPQGQGDRLLRLMDVFVSGDEELLSWWLSREKEMIFATLFDDDHKEKKGAGGKLASLIKTRISPRAELFCALIRSVQIKASVFSFSGPYLNAVAVPLCMQFLDAVHESATDLRQALAGPVTSFTSLTSTTNTMTTTTTDSTNNFLTNNLEDWMAVINGCRLAAAILTRENPWAHKAGMALSANSSVNDLARFGRSLEQLQNVFIEEFATTFVETYLLERMKLGRYLMRCSHFLSHKLEEDEEEDEDYDPDLSFDLKPCLVAVHKFLELCNSNDDVDDDDAQHFATAFAPRVMRAKVMPLLLDKFLEVALDLQGLTPEILPEGAAVFERDMNALFGRLRVAEEGDPVVAAKLTRLMDITKLMNMEAKPLQALQSALLCLVGGPEDPERPRWIEGHQFTADATLFEQAECMIRAKGFSLELDDALSILNRRWDLTNKPQWQE